MQRQRTCGGRLVEQLENRVMMSGETGSSLELDYDVLPPEEVVLELPAPGKGSGKQFRWAARPKKLRAPVERLWDAGDFYWYEDEQIKLYRMTDAIVVGVEKGVDPEQLNRELTRPGGVLRRFELVQILKTEQFTRDVLYLETDEPLTVKRHEKLWHATERVPGVTWASPAFETELGYKLIVTNEINVNLKDEVNPEEFFANGFTGYRRFFDDYIAYVPIGGVAALQRANEMHGMPEVIWASPNFFQQIIFY